MKGERTKLVTIVKGNNVHRVSTKQYENIFKKLGYVIVGQDKQESEDTVEETEVKEEREEIVTEEDADIVPISEMSKAQLMRFAKKHNIDTRGAKNVSEARRMIQKAMAEARV